MCATWEIHIFQINNIHATDNSNITLKLNDVKKMDTREAENDKNARM